MHVEPTADVDEAVQIGQNTKIWHLAQVRKSAVIGTDCIVGRGAYIGPGVRIGHRVKIQNHALVYEPAVVDDGAFIGPAVVFTNDHRPRAVNPDGSPKSADDWQAVGVTVREGASIGARAVCVAPVTIGAWSMVAAGSVVTKDVPAHALVAGVPARVIGWVDPDGQPLVKTADATWESVTTGKRYIEDNGNLTEIRNRR